MGRKLQALTSVSKAVRKPRERLRLQQPENDVLTQVLQIAATVHLINNLRRQVGTRGQMVHPLATQTNDSRDGDITEMMRS